MFYGVERSTDMRCPMTQIKKFTSKKSLQKWIELKSGNYTYADPKSAQNYHRSFRYGYELVGRIDKKSPIFKDFGSPTYPRTQNDNIYYYLCEYGTEITR